jgi:endonuclease/exonuclease/phosphatase family metal-dependent hydrolase
MKKKPGFLTRLLLIINYLFILGMILAYLASYINPEQFVFIAFFGLAYPVLLLGNMVFLLFWLLRGKRYLFLSLIIILLGWNHFQRHYQFGGKELEDKSKRHIKVLTYNVQNLSYSTYGKNEANREKMFRFLEQQEADILCLQEFLFLAWNSSELLEELQARTDLPYLFYENYNPESKVIQGLLLFSRHPFINEGSVDMGHNNVSAIYADMVTEEDTFRVYNIHYESIRLIGKDFEFVTELANNGGSVQEIREGSSNVLRKLARAFRVRGVQVEILYEHMKTSPYRIILCGDFNDTPSSYVYRTTKGDMKDAFIESGSGYNNTYAGRLPPLRIDYILCDPSLEIYDYEAHHDFRQSDHFPVTCTITLPN